MSTIVANSNSQADVATAIAAANAGDIVQVPAGMGNVTWNAGVTISKSLTLQGPGAAALTITRQNGFQGTMVTITALPSDVPVRVTGFTRTKL